ncbi:MAG TPA: SDR family NAD(P)-dependent oxidoreductase [Candidatus Binatia bacterium]|jgi:3-oxoacyl-[acyl-carrier protein] reductase|nr:SDR family NAD(P)-dependent oxidoreductase [Candidatus Binatia bacterium]
MRLAGKVALVTGAGQGLGEAMALRFAHEGAAVMVNDLREETAAVTAEAIRAAGGKAAVFAGSVMDEAVVEALVERTVKELGTVDILVNNAGITRDKLLKDLTAADWDAVLNLNLRGTFLVSKYATPVMVAARWGRVINMSSRAHYGNKGQTNYAASKAGVIGFTRSLSLELGKFGITANCIAPGIIATPGVTSLPHYQTLVDRVAPTLPIPRLGTPEDVAGVAAFLASDDAAYITGETIHVSGGRYG